MNDIKSGEDGDKVDSGRLNAALKRFEHAEFPDVVVRGVRWTTLEQFNATLSEFAKLAARSAIAASVEADLDRWFTCRRVLQMSLAQPRSPLAVLDREEEWGPIVDGELGRLQDATRAAARVLRDDTHKGVEALVEMASSVGRITWPRLGLARVIVPPFAVEATRLELSQVPIVAGLTWEVCSLAAARRLGHCDVTVLIGRPEEHLNWRDDLAFRSRQVAWLFNAPMSPHIVAMSWGGVEPCDVSAYEIDPRKPAFDPRLWIDGGMVVLPLVSREFPAPDESEWVQPNSAADLDPIPSLDFLLPDNHWISFGIDGGPNALRIDDDSEYVIDLRKEDSARGLTVGNILVLLEGTTERDLRDKFCGEWVNSQRIVRFEDARAIVSGYKDSIWSKRHDPSLLRSMIREGLPETYARSQIARANPSSPAMAPKKRSNFETIARIVGWTPPNDAWEHIEQLRSGYIHAGHEILELLAEHVRTDDSWQTEINERRISRISIPDLGRVTLAPIVAIASSPSMRGIEELGTLRRK